MSWWVEALPSWFQPLQETPCLQHAWGCQQWICTTRLGCALCFIASLLYMPVFVAGLASSSRAATCTVCSVWVRTIIHPMAFIAPKRRHCSCHSSKCCECCLFGVVSGDCTAGWRQLYCLEVGSAQQHALVVAGSRNCWVCKLSVPLLMLQWMVGCLLLCCWLHRWWQRSCACAQHHKQTP